MSALPSSEGEGTARRAELDRLSLLDTPPAERFDRVTRMARQMFGVRNAQVTLLDDSRQFIKSHAGLSDLQGGSAPLSDAICTETIREDRTFVVEDARADPRFDSIGPVVGDPHIRFYAGHPISAGGHRVGALCIFDDSPRGMTAEEEKMLAELAVLVETELATAVEMDRASRVQRGLLPHSVPALDGWELAGECLAASGMSGDFYDWYPVEGGLVVTLADVMGKGSGAAIVAATVRAVLRAGAKDTDIAAVVASASEALSDDLGGAATFATLFHGRLDQVTGDLEYVDAGHGLTLVVRADGTHERLASADFPLGVPGGPDRALSRLRLEAGDSLVTVSDGVLDLFDGTLASLDELAAVVVASADSAAVIDSIIGLARRQGAPDDVTVVALRRLP